MLFSIERIYIYTIKPLWPLLPKYRIRCAYLVSTAAFPLPFFMKHDYKRMCVCASVFMRSDNSSSTVEQQQKQQKREDGQTYVPSSPATLVNQQ